MPHKKKRTKRITKKYTTPKNHKLAKIKFKRYIVLSLPILGTIIFWVLAKINLNSPLTFDELPRLISQLIALIGTVLLAINYLLVTRMRLIEIFFAGLDHIYKLHNTTSRTAFALVLAHPILLAIYWIDDFELVQTLFIPGDTIAKTFGILSLYTYTILILVTIFKFLPYQLWKITHKFMGVPFIFGSIHALLAVSDIQMYFPLKAWMSFWMAIGIVSYLYILFLYKYWGPQHEYTVWKIKDKGDIHELYLKPKGRRINFEPGEFVFISFKNHRWLPKEQHPFSVSSSPDKEYLRISCKKIGDFTQGLGKAKVGDEVIVYGPYGEFTSYVFDPYKKQIWIAGGIGIAPFLSMLSYESHSGDSKDIHFFYCSHQKKDAVYLDEIAKVLETTEDKVRFFNNLSSKEGHLTAEKIKSKGAKIFESLILLCGPNKMMNEIKRQFIALGVPEDRIVFEDFDFL